MCVRTTGTPQKVTIFDPKVRYEIKKSVPFVRYTSCGETTMYITFLKSISFAVKNIGAPQHSQMSQLHFEIVAQMAICATNPPKKIGYPLKYKMFLKKIYMKKMPYISPKIN